MTLSPIVLFVYNRLWHTKQTIEALQKNTLAQESELFIYSDAPIENTSREQVQEVRDYLSEVTGFKKVTIIERDSNWGLARSIIDGVSSVVNHYGKIIVLEDDMVTSPFFLQFMNEALTHYQSTKAVWHVSGWAYPFQESDHDATYLWRFMNCWGWATWSDRWQYFEKDSEQLTTNFSNAEIKRFNLDGKSNFWQQVIDNHSTKLNTWAIFWYATIFQHNGLCLNPKVSYLENIGCDESGQHCSTTHQTTGELLNNTATSHFSELMIEDKAMRTKIQDYYRSRTPKLSHRIINKLRRVWP